MDGERQHRWADYETVDVRFVEEILVRNIDDLKDDTKSMKFEVDTLDELLMADGGQPALKDAVGDMDLGSVIGEADLSPEADQRLSVEFDLLEEDKKEDGGEQVQQYVHDKTYEELVREQEIKENPVDLNVKKRGPGRPKGSPDKKPRQKRAPKNAVPVLLHWVNQEVDGPEVHVAVSNSERAEDGTKSIDLTGEQGSYHWDGTLPGSMEMDSDEEGVECWIQLSVSAALKSPERASWVSAMDKVRTPF